MRRRARARPDRLRRVAGQGGRQQRAGQRSAVSELSATGSGLGIAGLRQRVELMHGTLRAGPGAGRRVPGRGRAACVRPDGRAARLHRTGGGEPTAGRATRMIRVVVVDDEPTVCAHLRNDPPAVRRHRGRGRGSRRSGRGRGRRPQPARSGAHGPAHPGVDGLTAIGEIGKLADPPVVVVLTTFDADQYVLRALRAGAAGFLVKSTPPTDLIGVVRVAADGHTVLTVRPPPGADRCVHRQPACPRARPQAHRHADRAGGRGARLPVRDCRMPQKRARGYAVRR